MAVDRAVLLSRSRGACPPTLRLYAWSKPTVSLGRFQSADDVDLEYCADSGIDVVRRATGGRGVLHDDELTYAVLAGSADGIPTSIARSYRLISRALLVAYARLGVQATLARRSAAHSRSGACYLHSTQADLSAGDAKLSGSAQVWLRGQCLQHGSIVRSRDVDRESRVFRLSAAGRDDLARGTATLESLRGTRSDEETIAQALVDGMSEQLGVSFEHLGLSAEERAEALQLAPEALVSGREDLVATRSRRC